MTAVSVPPPAAVVDKGIIPGPKMLMLGEPGDGKTHAVRTLIEAGLKVFVQFTEPGMEVLLDPTRGKVYTCAEGLHWHYTPPSSPSWQTMMNAANLISQFSYKQVTEMAGLEKEKFKQFYDFIAAHQSLKCDRCGVNFGAVENLPYNEWAFVLDGLSSLSLMALKLVIGAKPAAHQGEYGIAMMNLETYINKFVYDIRCMGVVLAHLEREGNEITGGTENMAATIGRKLAPKIPRPFSDVVHVRRDGAKYMWSTSTSNMKLKTRHLPLSNDIPASFKPVVDAWRQAIKLGKPPELKFNDPEEQRKHDAAVAAGTAKA